MTDTQMLDQWEEIQRMLREVKDPQQKQVLHSELALLEREARD